MNTPPGQCTPKAVTNRQTIYVPAAPGSVHGHWEEREYYADGTFGVVASWNAWLPEDEIMRRSEKQLEFLTKKPLNADPDEVSE